MLRSARLALLTCAALVLPMPLAHGAPAAPSATASVSFPDWRHVEGCHNYVFDYAVSPEPTDPLDWTLSILGDTSDGGGNFITSFSSSTVHPLPTSGQQSVSLCGGRHLPGTYTVGVTLLYTNAAGQHVTEAQPPATFNVVQPVATTKLKVKRAKRGKVVTKVSSIIPAFPGGEAAANEGADVRVQYRYKKLWVSLRGAKGETNNRGEVKFKTKLPKRAKKFRAIVKDQLYVDGATSKVVRLR